MVDRETSLDDYVAVGGDIVKLLPTTELRWYHDTITEETKLQQWWEARVNTSQGWASRGEWREIRLVKGPL